MATTSQPVVVGVDGSRSSVKAANWAVAEAGRLGAELRLVLVNDDPARDQYAEDAVRKIAVKCRAHEPGIDVTGEVTRGHPVEELLRRSATAQLVVVGARGHGGFEDALLGGVSLNVATHASCPVAAVRADTPNAMGPVVVGVDNSPPSKQALRYAFEAADRLGAKLLVIRAWHEDGLLGIPLSPSERDRVQRDVEKALTDQTIELRAAHPEVRTRDVAQRGHPTASLTNAARDARLLVVGHRGGGGFDGLLLGSVASGVLHHAPCTVVVVRHGANTGGAP